MELKDFLSQTLTQIIEGVAESQQVAAGHGAAVNPAFNPMDNPARLGFINCYDGYAQLVHFDVALTVSEGTGTKAGVGVFAGTFNLGASGQSNSASSSVSHVQFNVPLILPAPAKKT